MSEGRFNLSALAVRERAITLFLILLISLAGLVAFFKLGRAEDPAFTIKVMTIITAWPGATAQEMQDQVAEKVEKRLQELRYYDRAETYTRPGLAFTTLTLQDSTPPSKVQEEFYQARKKVGDEAGNLPAGVIGPMINDEYADVTFALFALKAKGEPQRVLVRDAETLRQRLLHVPGVKKVNIAGEQPERIYVEFAHDRLATLGIGPQDVFAALNAQNALSPAGSVETKGPQVFIRLDGAFDTLQKIRDTPVVAQGRTLKLSDVATVKRGYEDPSTFMIRSGGEPALLIGVVMKEGWNGLDLGKSLDAEARAINAELPLGLSLSKVTDQSVNIAASVDEFMMKFFAALLVVMLVSFLSMGWRAGLVVAAAVPLTLAVVFVVMAATGKNFDRITLGSLILALGLLVDDAIIAIEMMVVKIEEGYSHIAASAYAWSHTAAPMLSGTLVTAVGFMPNGFAPSTAGEYTSNMFWIVGIALIASWVVAVVFTPYLGVKLLPNFKKIEGGHAAIYDTPRYNRLRRVLERVIARKWLVAGAVIALFVLSILGMGVVKKQFFPISDRPEVLVEVQMPYGTAITQTSDATAKVEAWLSKQAEAQIVTSYIGQGAPRFFFAMGPELPDPSFAKIVIRTASQEERDALKLRLREAIAQGLAPERAAAGDPTGVRPVLAVPGGLPCHGAGCKRIAEDRGRRASGHGCEPDDAHRQHRLGHPHARAALHLESGPSAGRGPKLQCRGATTAVPLERRASDDRARRHPHRAGRRPFGGRHASRPGPHRGLHARRCRRSTHSAVAGRPGRDAHGRAGHAATRPHAHHHGAGRHRRRNAAAGRVERDHQAAAADHRQAARGLPRRPGRLHRGIGEGDRGDVAAVPDHAGGHASDHHSPGALDVGDGHGVPYQPVGTDRCGANSAHLPAGIWHQCAGWAHRAVGDSDAQHADSAGADPPQRAGGAGPFPRGGRGYGAASAARDPDGVGGDPRVHSADAFGVLGRIGVHADRRHFRGDDPDAGVPAGDVFDLVQDQTRQRDPARALMRFIIIHQDRRNQSCRVHQSS